MLISAKWENIGQTQATITMTGGKIWSGVTDQSRFWPELQDWIALDNTPDPFVPIVRPVKSDAPLNAEEIATLMVSKSLISRAEFDAIKTSR